MTEDIRSRTQSLLRQTPSRNLVAILQEVQKAFGYVPRESVLEMARFLEIPAGSIYSVVTFYNQFRLHPEGRHQVRVCLGTACHIKGGKIVLESWEREMGIRVGKTTPDMEYSLKTVACVGCCALAPVTVVDEEVVGRVTPIRVKGVLLSRQLKREGRLAS
ncbi:MAG: NAD(P)H-dependent oxidoreductase subunit E [Chloroflexi bacterium]|nr:NAD(P)H-dependent oxidoreductase subunit E [Chloroflexota bacterium]